MADDISELLDEVERKFCSPKATVSNPIVNPEVNPHGNSSKAPPPSSSVPLLSEEDDLDKIISDIVSDIDADFAPHHTNRKGAKYKKNPVASALLGRRCFPALIAGTSTPQGCSDSSTRRACNQLRCTSCDFHVISFDECAWHTRSNSLFFRNSMPEPAKLRENLINRKGCRAYACQCSWRSVVSIEELGGRGEREVHTERDVSTSDISVTVPQLSKLKWVCGRH